jgi:dephospho-CoA kinase
VPALTVGLTGGIGSGKSAALAALAALGAVVIDADDVARDVIATGTPGFDQVASVFGSDAVGTDGRVDRQRLAALVFADDEARARLEAIVHPLVREHTRRLIAATDPSAIVVNAVPLLVEAGLVGEYDVVVVVYAPLEVRLQRLLASRAMTRAGALARIAAQASDDDRARAATWVLVNDGTLDDLRARVTQLWAVLQSRRAGIT